MKRALLGLFAVLPLGQALAAEIPLYPTGPSEDSAFLRFFNAGETPLELNAANGASLRLEGEQRASDFLTVPAGKPIPAHLFGNMWAQQWDAVYSLLEPYPGVSPLDVDAGLVAHLAEAAREPVSLIQVARGVYDSMPVSLQTSAGGRPRVIATVQNPLVPARRPRSAQASRWWPTA